MHKMSAARPQWQNQPCHLTTAELKDPQQVINQFFELHPLSEVRDLMEGLYEKAFTRRPAPLIGYDAGEMDPGATFSVLRNIRHLLEAVYVKNKQGEKAPSFHQKPLLSQPPLSFSAFPAAATDGKLQDIVKRILEVIPVDKIYLNRTFQAGHADGYDLLLCLPATDRTKFNDCQQIVAKACQDIAVVSTYIQRTEELFIQLKNGHIFFSRICVSEQLAFDNHRAIFAGLNDEFVDRIVDEATTRFMRTYRKALFFWEDPRIHTENEYRAELLFNLHQVIEHTCRAISDGLTEYNLINHRLRRMLELTTRCAPSLADALLNEPSLLDKLQRAYHAARYDEVDISELEWVKLIHLISKFIQEAKIAFEEAIVSFRRLADRKTQMEVQG